jgi:hypothetical protein
MKDPPWLVGILVPVLIVFNFWIKRTTKKQAATTANTRDQVLLNYLN